MGTRMSARAATPREPPDQGARQNPSLADLFATATVDYSRESVKLQVHATKGFSPRLGVRWSEIVDQGNYDYMEDMTAEEQNENGGWVYFAVFDGHGSATSAMFLQNSLLSSIVTHASFLTDMPTCLQESYQKTDLELFKLVEDMDTKGGSTSVTLILTERKGYIANVGDASAILCKRGVATVLTGLHRLSNPSEQKRIQEARPDMVFTGSESRLFHSLAVTRAFGDFVFKRKERRGCVSMKDSNPLSYDILSCVPDIAEFEVTDDLEYCVLSSDGLVDIFGSQDLICMIDKKMHQLGGDLDRVIAAIISEAHRRRPYALSCRSTFVEPPKLSTI